MNSSTLASTTERLSDTAGGTAEAAGVPRRFVDAAIKDGSLPAFKCGRRYIVLREDALAWLRKLRQAGEIRAPLSQTAREKLAELNRTKAERERKKREAAAART